MMVIGVGGLGGSGTRVVAAILQQIELPIGVDLNDSLDNLWFTLFFKRQSVLTSTVQELRADWSIFESASREIAPADPDWRQRARQLAIRARPQHPVHWLQARVQSLERSQATQRNGVAEWAFKEPNSHVVIARLARFARNLRYIHVVRDGLDMAFSANRQQASLWARKLFGMATETPPTADEQLEFWCRANERVRQQADSGEIPSVLEVSYDRLCLQPTAVVQQIAAYCGRSISLSRAQRIASAVVRRPPTMGRWREADLSCLDRERVRLALDYREQAGFGNLLPDETDRTRFGG